MAKGKYEEWLSEEGLLKLEAWARDGLTNEQIASNIGISRKTLQEWCIKYSDISDTLKKGKDVADIQVENALFKKAIGYTVSLKKTFKVKCIEYDENTGKKISEREELVEGFDEMHIPADTTAQIFWLKNRLPEKWKDKKDIESDSGTGMLEKLIEGLKNEK